MSEYVVEIRAKTGCGCEASIDFELDGEPEIGEVARALAGALDPDETSLLAFLESDEHEHGGNEKITVTAQMKVR